MSQIKNLALLPETFDDKKIDAMEVMAASAKIHQNITFKIIDLQPRSILIQAKQGQWEKNNYMAEKDLVDFTRKRFAPYFPAKKILVNPLTFTKPAVEAVTAEWITEQMDRHSIKLKDIAAETGINYTYLSQIVNGSQGLSQAMKALFWYYFLSKPEPCARISGSAGGINPNNIKAQ